MAKNAYSTTAPTKVSKDATLPVRGTVAELKLEKKLPKKIDAIIVAIFEGEDSIELAGGEILDFIFSTEQQADILTQLEAVGAKATANSITRVPGTDVAPVIAVGLGKADLLDDETLRRASGTAARSSVVLKMSPPPLAIWDLQQRLPVSASVLTPTRVCAKKPKNPRTRPPQSLSSAPARTTRMSLWKLRSSWNLSCSLATW